MNWLKKGPELKLSGLKVPDFLYDLFYDLKERHLLPLVALLLVAMVAAPIYFKGSSKSEPEADATLPTTASASSVDAAGESLVVARSEPGLRDYRQRLKEYRALDPFRTSGGGTSANAEVTSSTPVASPEVWTPEASTPEAPSEATVIGGETSAPPEVSIAPPSAPESSGGPVESPPTISGGKTQTRYASDSIDVRIVSVPPQSSEQAKVKRAKPRAQVRRNLPELTMLPARATPAATYIGLTNDGKKALFVISSDVVSLFGEGKCVIGSQSCQLLALEPALPETFVYGPQERTYRIELLKIERTYASKPRRAALGVTKGKQHARGGAEGQRHGATGGPGTEAAKTAPAGEAPSERG